MTQRAGGVLLKMPKYFKDTLNISEFPAQKVVEFLLVYVNTFFMNFSIIFLVRESKTKILSAFAFYNVL